MASEIVETLTLCMQRLTMLSGSEDEVTIGMTASSKELHLTVDRLMTDLTNLCLDAIKRRGRHLHDQIDQIYGNELAKVKDMKQFSEKRESILVKCHKMSEQVKTEANNDIESLRWQCDGYCRDVAELERKMPSRHLGVVCDAESSAVSQKIVDIISKVGNIKANEDVLSDCISIGSSSFGTPSLASFNSGAYSAKSKPIKTFGIKNSPGPEMDKFNSPRGCTFLPFQGLFAVSDAYNNRVKVLDIGGEAVVRNLVFNIDRAKTISSKQLTFTGLATNGRDRLYMADAERGSIFAVNIAKLANCSDELGITDWPVVGILGSHGFQTKQFNVPIGIAVDSISELAFVCDSKNHQIKIWRLNSGEFLSCFGEYGRKSGQFIEPAYCAVAEIENSLKLLLAISDSGNNRIQLVQIEKKSMANEDFGIKATAMFAFGKEGSALGCLSNPRGVAFDPAGNIVVADAGNKRIHVFMKDGTPVCTFASSCGLIPEGICVCNETGNVIITDRKQHVVHVF